MAAPNDRPTDRHTYSIYWQQGTGDRVPLDKLFIVVGMGRCWMVMLVGDDVYLLPPSLPTCGGRITSWAICFTDILGR